MKQAALVTGAAVRLGKAIALSLAEQGYDILLHYGTSLTAAQETAVAIQNHGVSCHLFPLDLHQAEQIDSWLEEIYTAVPHLTLLINSASAYTQAPISQTPLALFDQQWQVNLRAPFFLTKAFANLVTHGNIINIIDNKIGFNQYQYAAYLLSKKALVELTKMAAIEFAPHIRVNGVAPGVVLPAVTRSQEYIEWRKQGIPLKMQGQITHITQTIHHILQNDFVTGQIFVVDGGENLTNTGQHAGGYDQSKV